MPYFSVGSWLFQTSFSRGFTKNMKLEAVNPRNPAEICVASVTSVKGRLMWLRLEGMWCKGCLCLCHSLKRSLNFILHPLHKTAFSSLSILHTSTNSTLLKNYLTLLSLWGSHKSFHPPIPVDSISMVSIDVRNLLSIMIDLHLGMDICLTCAAETSTVAPNMLSWDLLSPYKFHPPSLPHSFTPSLT